MASQGVTANSRLAEMQMRFQKKQLLEREQKKLALTGADNTQSSRDAIGNGKVRQMFDDRRRGVGIDRSHPLRPIITSTTLTTEAARKTPPQQASNKRLVGGINVARQPGLLNSTSVKSTSLATRNIINNKHSISNGNINVFQNNLDELDNIDNETFPKEFSSLSLNNTHVMGSYVINDRDLENNLESGNLNNTIVISKKTSPKTNAIQLKPVITKKSPITTTTTGKTTIRTPSSSSRVSTLSKTTTNTIKSPPSQAVTTSTTKTFKAVPKKSLNSKPATFVLSVKPPPRVSTPPPGMAACQYCQRHFNEDRLIKHEEVCRRMNSTKRKIFDASKHRVKGTEAEKYLKKGKTSTSTAPKSVTAGVKMSQAAKNSGDKKPSWRQKHEEFIAAIREAKKVQAYLAKGGKLSDLPPPPPSENPDYIQCPHCSRRFNESAAERHIPKCANMQHNKPKPLKKRL